MSNMYGNPGINPDKIRADIFDLKNKKGTLVLSIQNDIKTIDNTVANEFRQIGEKAYEIYKSGENSLAGLEEAFARIDKYKDDRIVKETKIKEISERYDEEITLLEKLVPAPAPAPAPTGYQYANTGAAQAFCMNCRAPYIPGVDGFCRTCGYRLA